METCSRNNDRFASAWLRLLRTLPAGTPGKWRLARLLMRRQLSMRDVLIRDKFGCIYTVPSLKEPIGFSLLVDGVYEPKLLYKMRSLLKPDSVVVDVGANIGTFTLPISTFAGDRGTVLAIEGSPTMGRYLTANVRANNLRNVILENCVVADRENQGIDFYEAPTDHFGMGSLAPQFSSRPIRTPSTTLDALILKHNLGHVDIVKVDVEGYEAPVFRGAQKLFSSERAPIVFFEFTDWGEERRPKGHAGESQEALRTFGYKIWRLSSFCRNGMCLTGIVTQGSDTLVAMKQR